MITQQFQKEKIKRIVFCTGDIETLGYFSQQLLAAFHNDGYEVFLFNFKDEIPSMIGLARFLQKGKAALVTFNYTGLIGETCFNTNDGHTVWNEFGVYCINIVVDHPFYYHKFHPLLPKRYFQYCIDRNHVAYMHRFFPRIQTAYLPLGGTRLHQIPIPYEERSMDLVFTGNYTPPRTFRKDITRINDEYTAFYYRILHDLKHHPDLAIEAAIEKHVRIDIPEITEQELRDLFPNMVFLDLYIRFYFRGLVIKTLADAGFQIHVYGTNWDKLSCRHPENLILGGRADSMQCLEAISNTRISLNVMPWFKDGAHDRIYNSMANGALSVTDSSTYLKETLINDKEVIFYSLNNLGSLPDILDDLLSHPQKAKEIALCGYQKAISEDLWANRAKVIEKQLDTISL